MADTAYAAISLRQASLPNSRSRHPQQPFHGRSNYPLDKHSMPSAIPRGVLLLKTQTFAASQPAFEKTVPKLPAVVTLAAIILWMR